MDQKPPMNRTPQRPPEQRPSGAAPSSQKRQAPASGGYRPAQARPQGSPTGQSAPGRSSRYSTAFLAILISTVALLVLSLIVLCVVLAVGGFESKPDNNDGGDNVENVGGNVNTPVQTRPVQTPQGPTAKFLTLPSATAAGSYASTSASGAQTMANDAHVKSAAAIVVDMSGKVSIGEKNADTKVYPASMTKVMTVLLACEKASSATDKLTVTEQMLTDLVATNGASTIGGW